MPFISVTVCGELAFPISTPIVRRFSKWDSPTLFPWRFWAVWENSSFCLVKLYHFKFEIKTFFITFVLYLYFIFPLRGYCVSANPKMQHPAIFSVFSGQSLQNPGAGFVPNVKGGSGKRSCALFLFCKKTFFLFCATSFVLKKIVFLFFVQQNHMFFLQAIHYHRENKLIFLEMAV
jgi:hypothetical protein